MEIGGSKMKPLVFVLAAASLLLATCSSSSKDNAAEKYYEPVDTQWQNIEIPLVTETDLGS